MERGGTVYIITNKHHTVLYIGVTSNLKSRISQHREGCFPDSFSARYNLDKLVFYENFSTITEAIVVEKKLKGRSRIYKEKLITKLNPGWKDLWEEVSKW